MMFLKLGFDADSDVRDASFVAFGAIMRIVGENGINIYCGDIVQDEGKLAKVFSPLPFTFLPLPLDYGHYLLNYFRLSLSIYSFFSLWLFH